jgi:cytochrome c oxidase subunit 2
MTRKHSQPGGAGHGASGGGSEEHVHAVPLPILLGVWGILIVLTWLTVAATKIDLGGLNIVIALAIAVVKSTFVALYFMHLRYDRPFNSVIFVGALLFVMLFISFALLDTRESRPTLIAGYAPAIQAAELARGGSGGDGGAAAAGAGGAAAEPAASLEKADPERGRQLFQQTCIACHGPEAAGMRQLNSPALHIQEDWYIAAQLIKFRTGIRGTDPKDITGLQMAPMAKALPDDQAVYDLAAYISSIDGPMPEHEIQPTDLAAGERHYKTVCIACHGPDGKGIVALNSPSLVGQSDWYLAAQLRKFKEGLRGTKTEDVTGMQMRPMAMTLVDDAMVENVAAYIATMPAE